MPQLTRSQLAAYAAIGLLVLVLGGHWLARGSGGAGASSAGSSFPASSPAGDGGGASGGGAPAQGVAVEGASRSAVVHVAGAVRHPGVYRLAPGARVQDAVRRAGGATRHGDANAINLAAVLQDGVQIVVPQRVAGGAAAAVATAAAPDAPPAAPVNLNSATAEQLDTLDGVGPATAQKILDYRRQHGGFRTVDDLGQVPGIGPKKLAALRGKVQV